MPIIVMNLSEEEVMNLSEEEVIIQMNMTVDLATGCVTDYLESALTRLHRL